MLEGAHRSGLVGEVAFGHPVVGGAEDTLAGAGVGFGQHGDGGHAGECPHRFHTETFEQFAVRFHLSQLYRFPVRSDQELFADVTPAFSFERMPLDGFKYRDARADFLERGMCRFHPVGGVFASLPPGFALGVEFFVGEHVWTGEGGQGTGIGQTPFVVYNGAMAPEVVEKLLDINRQFYQTFAEAFDATRQRVQPGVARVLGMIPPQARILDLGCGNGEVARELARRGFAGEYGRGRF
ncbi:MAG: hypothetical protein HC806_06905 [Anaerolineae bacterium]|nr:hypothetical protein [Anaerolineae bacterium]